MVSIKLVENYALEILSRSLAIRDNCDFLLTYDYSSQSPKKYAKTIIKICDYLSNAIIAILKECDVDDIENTINLLRYADLLTRHIGAHVRYIEGARSEKLPWSIIPSFKKLISQLFEDVHIMLRPKWKYNYSVDLADLRLVYKDALTEFEDYVPMKSIENDVLDSLPGPFHLISFPFIERKNILLHSLLGHEIGHLFADKYLTKEKKDDFANTIIGDIQEKVERELKGSLPKEPLISKLIIENEKNNNLQEARNYWVRGLEELISDIVGAILFGPAAVFASLEFAMQEGFNLMPSNKNDYYPPWGMRLREIIKILDNYGEGFFPIKKDDILKKDEIEKEKIEKIKKINERYEEIKDLIKNEDDQAKISADPIAKIAYDQIKSKYLSDATHYLLEDFKLKDHLITASSLYKNLYKLIERLDHGIPPNAVENKYNDRHLAKLVEIINASWFHKISWNTSFLNDEQELNDEIYKMRNRMNNLTLKAVEYSYIESRYIDKVVEK